MVVILLSSPARTAEVQGKKVDAEANQQLIMHSITTFQ
jgi:hypothetical protein